MFEKLTALEARLDAVNRAMMDPSTAGDSHKFRDLAKEHSQLSEVVDLWNAWKKVDASLVEAKELYGGDDEELRELAKGEIPILEKRLDEATQALRLALLPKDPNDGRPVILEVRAGTGGDEAALFAADLYRMYRRFGEVVGLRFEEMSSSPIVAGGGAGSSARGYKEVVCSVSGKQAWRLLRFEGGVHRVQRIPATESQGRIHTSAATVAVLPEPDEIQVKIEQKDLRIDTMRSGGPGGQSVNTTDSAVRIVHIPTGMIVVCQDEKSQIKNREKAMRVLKARLLEKEESERHAEETAARRAMVGSGDRSERIRTYNFPQNRLTDHRIGLTLYKLELIMNGDLTEVVEALANSHQAELLASQESR